MTKRKRDQIGGLDPWDIEMANYSGADRWGAEAATIVYWMVRGDLRPLIDLIKKNEPPHELVLEYIFKMIEHGHLVIKSRRGRPQAPERNARDIIVAKLYETLPGNSEDKFRAIADQLGISEATTRQAVTRWRKSNAK